jgi:hypothetical protein
MIALNLARSTDMRRIELFAHGNYLTADVFALAVAVCPYHELVRAAGLRLEVPDEIF